MTRTKIIATLGPSTFSRSSIQSCIQAGMDTARFNMSHSTHEGHKDTILNLRELSRYCWKDVPVQFDLMGSSVRTAASKPMDIIKGAIYRVSHVETEGCIKVCYDDFHRKVKPGRRILIDDGRIQLRVKKVEGTDIYCKPLNSGVIQPNKSVHVPGQSFDIPTLTEKDWRDLRFGVNMGVEYFAVSFVRSRKDVTDVKEFLESAGSGAKVIAKIESPDPMKNLSEIIRASDGIMIARGDMGVTMPLEMIPLHQYNIIRKCRVMKRFVITATELMTSMIDRPTPTRAEVNDVFMSVAAGSDALMLSNETAVGRYPVETITMMKRIIEQAEKESSIALLRSIWS